MKQIITYYLIELLFCFLIGFIVALMKFYSGWFVFAMSIPISFGWIPVAEINRRLEADFQNASLFILLAFLLIVAVFIICALLIPDKSFFAVTAGGGIFCILIVTIIILFRVQGIAQTRRCLQ